MGRPCQKNHDRKMGQRSCEMARRAGGVTNRLGGAGRAADRGRGMHGEELRAALGPIDR